MATLLYRLGRFSARRRWLVLAVWAVLLAVVASLAFGLKQTAATDTSFSIPGTEASKGLDVVGEKFSAGADNSTATVVFQARDGQTFTTEANAAAVESLLGELRGIDGVVSVSDPLATETPYVNADQTIAAATVTFDGAAGDVSEETRDAFNDATDHDLSTEGADVRVEATSEFTEVEGSHASEGIGIAIAFVVLVLTYGSLAAAGANLLTAAVGVGAGFLGITALSNVVSLSATAPALATMLGLAVGIDYALFIFARTRTELRKGATVAEAVAKATGTAGTAVVFAGATVIIALAGLSVVNIPFLTQMGLAAAATVAVAVVVALTAVPALLSVLGKRVLPKKERHLDPVGLQAAAATEAASDTEASDEELSGKGILGRWSRTITRHPVISLLSAVLVVGIVAVPVASLRLALPSAETADPASSSRQAYDLLVEGFGEGSQSTLIVVVDGDSGSEAATVATAATKVADQIRALNDVVTVTAPVASPDGSAQLITVVPGSGPTDERTTDLVHDIRDAVADTSGADVLVTGQTALNIDISTALNDALPVYIAVIVILALVLLVMLFRSIAVPLLATVGFLLSLGASLGSVVAIYQWGWLSDVFGVAQPAPILSFMPVIVVGILFGLAMDYQMFLVSAIHEQHSHGHSSKRAILSGFRQSAPVVVAAALIMAGVFFGFAFSGDATIGAIGMALAVGVIADAFFVRMIMMPAALTLLGDKAWWMPRWMQRIVPNVDAEGRSLDKLLAIQPEVAPAAVTSQPQETSLPAPRREAPAATGVTTTTDKTPVTGSGLAIVGRIVNASSEPVDGAAITLTDHSGRQVARGLSNENGEYRLALRVGGTYVLIAAGAASKPAAAMVAVSDHQIRHDVQLAGTSAIRGRITATPSTGLTPGPIASAVITLLDVRGAVVATTRSDRDGKYEFIELVGGTHVLSVLSDEFRPVAQTVELLAGKDVRLDVQLSTGGRLLGTVVADSDGRVVREAAVTLIDAQGTVVDSTVTGADGEYRFDDLTGGSYTLTASGYAPVATTVEVNENSESEADVRLSALRPQGSSHFDADSSRR